MFKSNQAIFPRVVRRELFCLVPLIFTLVACTSNATRGVPSVDYQIIIPHNAESYEEKDNQTFVLGERIGVPALPVYPPGSTFTGGKRQ